METFVNQYALPLALWHRIFASVLLVALSAGFATSASARTYAVVVAGLGGAPEYQESFADTTDSVHNGLLSLGNDPSLVIRLDESATREDILAAIEQQSQRIASDIEQNEVQPVFALMMVGHGNADNSGWRFNIAGPDITSDDLIAALNQVQASKQLVVLASSASGAVLESMSQLGRVLVTATKSGGEINAVRFHEYLGEALADDVADFDRNEILTIAEAYRFAESRTREYYEQQSLLASEHSRISGEEADDIALALLGSLRDARDNPAVATLLDERLVLEQTFHSLKSRKADMEVEEYYNELETLLLSIARLQQTIDETSGWSDRDSES